MRDDPRVTPVGQLAAPLLARRAAAAAQRRRAATCRWSGRGRRCRARSTQYGDDVRRRLLVRPGLTGLWQISGRSDLSWDESVRLDLHYVENWSLALDVMIIWKTVFAVLQPQRARTEPGGCTGRPGRRPRPAPGTLSRACPAADRRPVRHGRAARRHRADLDRRRGRARRAARAAPGPTRSRPSVVGTRLETAVPTILTALGHVPSASLVEATAQRLLAADGRAVRRGPRADARRPRPARRAAGRGSAPRAGVVVLPGARGRRAGAARRPVRPGAGRGRGAARQAAPGAVHDGLRRAGCRARWGGGARGQPGRDPAAPRRPAAPSSPCRACPA